MHKIGLTYVRERIRAWLSDRENLFFAALIVLNLIPIWGFKYFPSQDGPIHVENASIIREYHHQDLTTFRDYYILNKKPVPYWSGHLIMAGLMFIVPVLIAEKIFLTSYVILLPVSTRYALMAIRPESGFLAFLAFPFIYNFLLHWGFYNFCYSLPMFFFVVGYWIKNQERFTLRKTVTLMILTLLLYFSHLFSLVTAWLAIGILLIWLMLLELILQLRRRQFHLSFIWNAFRSRALMTFFAFLPTLILVAMFHVPKGAGMSTTPLATEFLPRLLRLLYLNSLVSYLKSEALFSAILVFLFMIVIVNLVKFKLLHRQVNRWDGLLFVVAAYVYIYFTVPDSQYAMSRRMNFYPFFALILWFGAQSYNRLGRLRIQLVAAGITVILLGFNTTKYVQLNDYLEEYLSGMHLIEPNKTLLPLCFSPHGRTLDDQVLSSRIAPFLHASGYIAAQRHIVELDNEEAGMVGFFPVTYRPKLNPFMHISQKDWSIEWEPPSVDFLTYHQRTGGQVDYVLVWGIRDKQRDLKDTKSIFSQLEAGYELIYTSPQRGLMQLYRRNNWGY